MYPAAHFQEHNIEQLHTLVNEYPLANVFMPCKQSDLNKHCHVPLLFDAQHQLFIGHVTKDNPLSGCNNQLVNLLFNGENAYLSPSYANNKTLPSWLYCSVLVTAKVRIITCNKQRELIMTKVTTHFEKGFEPVWSVDNVPKAHKEAMYQQLSFVELQPTNWQGNFKLSQNKPAAVKDTIKESLIKVGQEGLAKLIN